MEKEVEMEGGGGAGPCLKREGFRRWRHENGSTYSSRRELPDAGIGGGRCDGWKGEMGDGGLGIVFLGVGWGGVEMCEGWGGSGREC